MTIRSTFLAAAMMTMALGAASPAAADCGNRPPSDGPALLVVALTADQRLVYFKDCAPERVFTAGQITGLVNADSVLVGIDRRVQDGKLYGVGNGGGVYTIDPWTAVATIVSKLSVALEGTSFGVDFNPAADRLRIVSDTGQNLRHNVNPGGTTIADAALNNGGTTASGVNAAAYTNNDLNADTGTTLFDLDLSLDQVSLQSPPNNGSLVATGKLTLDAGGPAAFDIYTRLENGVAVENRAFAALNVGGVSGWYRIDLLTGKATLIDVFADVIVGMAIMGTGF